MSNLCVDRPALSIGEIHVWTARLVDEQRATADLLAILSREESAQAAHLLDIDADRVIELHREHAAIAAARDAELEMGAICPPSQIRLPMMSACKGQCRCVRI